MSGVWGWFGGQSAQKRKDTPKNAILGLRSHLEMLQKRERHLQNQMDEQDAIARKNVSSNKNGTSLYSPLGLRLVPVSLCNIMADTYSFVLLASMWTDDLPGQPQGLHYDERSNMNTL